MKPLIRRARADQDVAEAIEYYLEHAPEYVSSFVDELERAYQHLQRRPGTGSPRYAHELNIPGLRFWACKKFPYAVFYVERAESIEVWRVLHGSRDIPAWLREDQPR